MPAAATCRPQFKVMLIAAVLSAACMAQPTDGDDLDTDAPEDTSEVNTTNDVTPGVCNLVETNGSPVVTLSGRLCGETVSITTRAGKMLHLGRSSATDPEAEVRIVEVLDTAQPGAPANLRDSQFLINLAFETGPELADGVSTHNLASGVFSLCGFGTVVFLEGPVIFQFVGVDANAQSGNVALSLTGLSVSGYSDQHGQERVSPCGGELDVTINGRLSSE